MMSLFLMWLGVMFPLVFSPGPANIVFAVSGGHVGFRRSIPLVAGIDTVFVLKSVVVGFGLGRIINSYPNVMGVMQILGGLYLVYLALRFLKFSGKSSCKDLQVMGFFDGVIIQLLNSKGWLMVLLMFALFTGHAQEEFGDRGVLVLIVWLAILNISIHLIWVKAGAILANISSNRYYEKSLNIFYAACLMAVALWLMMDLQFNFS